MNFVKRFFTLISLLMNGLWKFVKEYAIPAIDFIEAIKNLVENPIPEKEQDDFNYKSYFKDKLAIAEKFITQLLYAFKAAMMKLLPDIGKEKSFAKMIMAFANYLKTLETHQKNMYYFKVVSLMLIELINPRKYIKDSEEVLCTSEADMLTQLTYTYIKYKNLRNEKKA